MTIAKVEPLTTARGLRGPFDYRVGPDDGVEIGSLLVVPFARRRILGVVTGLAERSELPDERLAEPEDVLEASTTPELVELGRWVAERWCTAASRGIALALPPGAGTGKRPRAPRTRTEARHALTERGLEALAGAERLGARQEAALRGLARAAAEGRGELTGTALASAGADAGVLARLRARGLLATRRVAVRRRPELIASGEAASSAAPALTGAQRTAGARISAALATAEPTELLLHGVTGSGKTEVYLAAIEETLALGRSAILLVPEIGLTPQTLARVSARLGEQVAVIHSALAEGERYDEWRRLRDGHARVCVGPRSAVFAPLDRLGLVIVDEEHDSSYKQEGDPRYDARTVAARRVREAGGVLVAGSATPRPESWASLERLELPERVDDRPMPAIELLDMRETSPRSGPLHPRTREALASLPADGKAIVMLNRRGFSPHLACATCGDSLGCPHCDVSLVLHRAGRRMSCHHCAHSEPVPRTCPACGSASLARYGAGTERIEQLVSELVEPASVVRLDLDTAAGGGHGRLLADFGAARGGVLVGTQMVAKGHDFGDVVLGVLLDADSTLRYPDFRAEERTFALVSQLSGRSGRGSRPGRVLVQTLAPEAAPIAAAARHDTSGFLGAELERRRAFGYPPFSTLIAVELTGPDEARLIGTAETLAAALEPELAAADPGAELLGPAPRFRRRGRFRRRLLVKTRAEQAAIPAIRSVTERAIADRGAGFGGPAGVALAVDVDPQ